MDDLTSTVSRVLGSSLSYDDNLKTACHLVTCWTNACHRASAELSARKFSTFLERKRKECTDKTLLFIAPGRASAEYESSILALWAAVDQTRNAIQLVQSHLYSNPSPNPPPPPHHDHDHDHHSHSHSYSEQHFHETDYIMQVIRQDRDLLDVYSMIHTFLLSLRTPSSPHLLRESNSKVRKGLKTLAFYSKVSSFQTIPFPGEEANVSFLIARSI